MRAKAPRRRSLSAGNERKERTQDTPSQRQKEQKAVEDKRVVEDGIRGLGLAPRPATEVLEDEDVQQPASHPPARDSAGPLSENRARTALSRLRVDDNAPRPSPGKSMRKKIASGHQQLRQERSKRAEAKLVLQTEGIRVFDRVFLGGKKAAANGPVMLQRNVRAVVNATKDIKCYFDEESLGADMPSLVQYMRLRVDDDQEEDIHHYFDAAADFIDETLSVEPIDEGDVLPAVFIHCQMGQSRSPSIVLACKPPSPPQHTHIHKNHTCREPFLLVIQVFLLGSMSLGAHTDDSQMR